MAACPGARVDAIGVKELSFTPFSSFTILPSEEETPLLPRLTPDLPTCETCERELLDPQNRRYRYPFLSCVACGPRYSIQRALPYDRETTTMDRFPRARIAGRNTPKRGTGAAMRRPSPAPTAAPS